MEEFLSEKSFNGVVRNTCWILELARALNPPCLNNPSEVEALGEFEIL